MSRPAFLLHSKHGFATPTRWIKSPSNRCIVFHDLAAARRAAKNLACYQRCAIEVINCERPRRGFSIRHVQSMACLVRRRELDTAIQQLASAGVLVTTATSHHYGY
jgi:hypothetical protein